MRTIDRRAVVAPKPFDFFPFRTDEERRVHDWKFHEATNNNQELLERAAKEANAKRFMN